MQHSLSIVFGAFKNFAKLNFYRPPHYIIRHVKDLTWVNEEGMIGVDAS